MKNILKNTLSTKAHWTINKKLSRELGLETTLILQHFIDLKYNVFGGKEFYQQINRIEEELPLTEYSIKKSIKQLEDLNLITVEKKGMPAKNYYNINDSEVAELLDNLDSTTSQVNSPSQVGDSHSEPEINPKSDENTTTSESKTPSQVTPKSTGKEKKQTKKEIKENKKAKKKQANTNNVNSERYNKLDELVKEFCESYSINESYIKSLGEIDMKQLKSKNYNQWDNIRLIKEMMSERDNSINI